MAAKAFLEQYMDCMDGLPLDLQRYASQYWEIDSRSKDILTEAQRVQIESDRVLTNDAMPKDKLKWLIQLQRVMISMLEVGSEKVEITGSMLDSVEGYSQQLTLAEKELTSCRTRDELIGGSSTRNSSSYSQHKAVASAQPSLPVLLEVVEKKKAERSQKRVRVPQDKSEDTDVPPVNKEARRESNHSVTSNTTTSTTNNNNTSNVPMKSLKNKKVKKKRNSIVKEQQSSGTHGSHHHQSSSHSVPSIPAVAVPTPDFTTEPIDPDEPTYCLCNQVSFGEMIGCDNDDCPIEWFHFQCVGLTAKPKGKWYCPQCQSERSKNRSSKV